MSKFNISRLTNENEDGAPKITGISTFSSTAFFEPPKGTTAQRPEFVQPGMIRFNTDGAHLEYYNGVEWTEVLVTNNSLDGGNRGLFAGGMNTAPSNEVNIIDYVNISSIGNAIDFGDLTVARDFASASSSATRGIWFGGVNPGVGGLNTIDYVTISSTGNAIDFGSSQSTAQRNHGSVSDGTRGIYAGTGTTNIIEYVTIASTGTRQDFGDLYYISTGGAGVNSSTRGVFCGGSDGPAPVAEHNVIQYITISTLGNSTDFGDLTSVRGFSAGACNSTRGVIGGGQTPTYVNTIDYITISTLGNAVNFGNLSQTRTQLAGCSSPTRGVFGGGYAPGTVNTIDYVTILSQGNATDFGDLSQPRRGVTACSNGHGGL